jgi:hypothetical protein
MALDEPYVPGVTPVVSINIVRLFARLPPPPRPEPVDIVRVDGTATAPTRSAMVVRLVTPFWTIGTRSGAVGVAVAGNSEMYVGTRFDGVVVGSTLMGMAKYTVGRLA